MRHVKTRHLTCGWSSEGRQRPDSQLSLTLRRRCGVELQSACLEGGCSGRNETLVALPSGSRGGGETDTFAVVDTTNFAHSSGGGVAEPCPSRSFSHLHAACVQIRQHSGKAYRDCGASNASLLGIYCGVDTVTNPTTVRHSRPPRAVRILKFHAFPHKSLQASHLLMF
ncbi:hypothetical protein TcWFU_009482 [Taenia crassiceps]|uniref:Uncharacterized protein n=1 Tax=Taenia crassiceps TaxID=6207 RepID=A0ABR4QC28_9CEST